MVYDDTSLMDVVLILTRHDYCFLAILDEVVGVITRVDMERPIVRMWLFGMITIIEIEFAASIRRKWPNESWRDLCPAGRLRKAEALCEERLRISQQSDLHGQSIVAYDWPSIVSLSQGVQRMMANS